MDEEELLLQFQACADTAGAVLVERYQDRLLGRALRMLLGRAGAHEVAEDLVQETFLRAKSRSKPAGSPVASWLFLVLHNLIRDYLRNPRRRHDPIGEPVQGNLQTESSVPSQEAGPLERLLQQEEHRRLYECLQRLPPEQEIAFRLYHVEGLTYEQIGIECGCALTTARNRILRARVALQECMTRNS
jgi:RNA polymerase sigma-70 factor, ECF subfamily